MKQTVCPAVHVAGCFPPLVTFHLETTTKYPAPWRTGACGKSVCNLETCASSGENTGKAAESFFTSYD